MRFLTLFSKEIFCRYKVSVVENIGCVVVYEETIGKNELDYGEDKRNKCNNSIQGI